MTHIERQLLKHIEGINSNKSGGIPVSPNKINEVLKNEAQNFIDILSQLIPNDNSGKKIFDAGLIQTTTEIIDGVGYIHINFPHEDAHRDSWYPEGYPEGADLIFLFNEGYDASKQIWIKYEDKTMRFSLVHRDPLYFIQKAVTIYNSKNSPNIKAEYNKELYT